MAQLVEQLLLIPEVRGSKPVIGNNLYSTFTVNCIEKTKKEKRGREWPIFSKNILLQIVENITLKNDDWKGAFVKTRIKH